MATFPRIPKIPGIPTLPIGPALDRLIELPILRNIKIPPALVESVKRAIYRSPVTARGANLVLSLLGENFRLANVPVIRDVHPWFDKSKTNVAWIPINEDIERPKSVALPTEVVRHFIRKSKYRFKVDVCGCRLAYTCSHYPVDVGCLMMGESASEIASLAGRMVSVEEGLEHLDRAVEAGLVPVIGKARVDNDIFRVKDRGKLLTLCLCCECCCITRYSKHLPTEALDATFRPPEGLTIRVDEEKCVGCGKCVEVCYVESMKLAGGVASPGERCRICGRCASHCPNGAIHLAIRDPGMNQALIERIERSVDLN